MRTAKRNKLVKSKYDRDVLSLIDKFEKETGRPGTDYDEIVDWADANGLIQIARENVKKKFRRDLVRASGKDFIIGDDGQPVRRRHPFTEPKTQKTFWKVMENMTPDEMRVSYQLTRRRIGGEVFQKERDIQHFNTHHNPGDPIQTKWDWSEDILDSKMPAIYSEEPPEALG